MEVGGGGMRHRGVVHRFLYQLFIFTGDIQSILTHEPDKSAGECPTINIAARVSRLSSESPYARGTAEIPELLTR